MTLDLKSGKLNIAANSPFGQKLHTRKIKDKQVPVTPGPQINGKNIDIFGELVQYSDLLFYIYCMIYY